MEIADNGDDPPMAISAVSRPHSSFRVPVAFFSSGCVWSRWMAGLPPCGWNSRLAVGRQHGLHIFAERLPDLLRVLSADEANETFAPRLRRNDRLEAFAGIAPVIPLISAVGRAQVCSRMERPFSPAGTERPIAPRNFSGEKPSPSHIFLISGGVSGTPS